MAKPFEPARLVMMEPWEGCEWHLPEGMLRRHHAAHDRVWKVGKRISRKGLKRAKMTRMLLTGEMESMAALRRIFQDDKEASAYRLRRA